MSKYQYALYVLKRSSKVSFVLDCQNQSIWLAVALLAIWTALTFFGRTAVLWHSAPLYLVPSQFVIGIYYLFSFWLSELEHVVSRGLAGIWSALAHFRREEQLSRGTARCSTSTRYGICFRLNISIFKSNHFGYFKTKCSSLYAFIA